jgi:hypothetical protein
MAIDVTGSEAWFNKDVRVYGCLYVNPSCGIVFQSPNGTKYEVTINNEGDIIVNNNNIGFNVADGLTEVTQNGFTNEVANNGFGTRTVSEGLPGGGATPDNTIGEDGDTWLVVEC